MNISISRFAAPIVVLVCALVFMFAPVTTRASSSPMCADGQTAANHYDGRCPDTDTQALIQSLIAQVARLQQILAELLAKQGDGATRIYIKEPAPNAQLTIGSPVNFSWRVEGAPQNSQVLIYWENVDLYGGGGVGPGTWQSQRLPIGTSNDSYAWQTGPGRFEVAGTYKVQAYVVACEPQGCDYNYDEKQGGLSRQRYASSVPIYVHVQYPTSGSIAVTAPNGGEQWEIGQLNTITWAPYSYTPTEQNPARDVDVYLEQCRPGAYDLLNCVTIGKVMDQGKASLHTYFNIDSYDKWAEAGSAYYIRATNRVTGQSDLSDAPFTLLPRSVDVKVNGQDSGNIVTDGQPITVSWTTANFYFSSGCTLSGVRTSASGPVTSVQVPANGSATYYAYAPTPGAYSVVQLSCVDGAKGLTHTDYASITSQGSSQLSYVKILSPNGGENFNPSVSQRIAWLQSGISDISVALYRNDQWFAWISKNEGLQPSRGYVEWTPQTYIDNASAWGNVFKIYVTARKSDGTGYVDDKSDATFGFLPQSTVNPTFTATPTSGTAPLFVQFTTNQKSGSIDYDTNSFLGSCPTNDAASGACNMSLGGVGWTYNQPGTYTASLREPLDGRILSSIKITVSPPNPVSLPRPTASLKVNSLESISITEGTQITFNWSSTGANANCDLVRNGSAAGIVYYNAPANGSYNYTMRFFGGETQVSFRIDCYRERPTGLDGLATALVTVSKAQIAVPPTPQPTPPAPTPSPVTLTWSYVGPISGMTCTQMLEPSDPHTWNDNYICASKDIGMRWSYAGPIGGMNCTQIIEPSDPDTWNDNYLCVPSTSGMQLRWSFAGNPGGTCVQVLEPSDPNTWNDNYLCYNGGATASSNLMRQVASAAEAFERIMNAIVDRLW